MGCEGRILFGVLFFGISDILEDICVIVGVTLFPYYFWRLSVEYVWTTVSLFKIC